MVAIVRLNPLMSLLLGERSAPFDGASLPLVYAGAPGILLRAERRRWRPGRGRAHRDAWTGGRAVVAFPVALGAKRGRPEAPVIAVHGDGRFLMNAQEIETAVRHNIGVVTIVMNNNCWGPEKAALIEIPIDPDEFPTPAAAVRRPD